MTGAYLDLCLTSQVPVHTIYVFFPYSVERQDQDLSIISRLLS